MHAPIELGPRLYGVLSVGHEQPERFSTAKLDLLAHLARSSAAAIANAIDFQRERHIARSLTLGFVPESLPRVPDYDTGLLYAPALGEPTGGDLYGVWQLPSGAVAVLVGDVAGKGVETAALSAMVRFFVEARSWDTESPGRVLEQTNAMLSGRLPSDSFVTAFLAVLGPESLRWASAGHLPPLHLAAGRRASWSRPACRSGVDDAARYGERQLELAGGRPRVRVHGRAGRGPARRRVLRGGAARAPGARAGGDARSRAARAGGARRDRRLVAEGWATTRSRWRCAGRH